MQSNQIPTRMGVAWGTLAGPSYIRTVPVDSQIGITDGAASFQTGFPPLNFTPKNAGGVPPFGQDMNGVINALSLWSQWVAAGGPKIYDSAFSTAINGYPAGTILNSSVDVQGFWLSIAENNTNNPDSNPTGWIGFRVGAPGNFWRDTGAVNALVITPQPAVGSAYHDGLFLLVQVADTNTGASTINVNGLGAKAITYGDGTALLPTSLVSGYIYALLYDANAGSFQVLNPSASPQTKVVLPADQGYYVNPSTGNDSNNGLTSGTAWQTLQHAYNWIQQNVNLNGFKATINCAAGTYATGLNALGPLNGQTANDKCYFLGDTTTPSNCLVTVSGAAFAAQNGAHFQVQGFKTVTGTQGIVANGSGSQIQYGFMDFGACGNGHVVAEFGATTTAINNYTISGSAAEGHFLGVWSGQVIAGSITITLTGTPDFGSDGFALAQYVGALHLNGITFSGSGTGKRYLSDANSIVYTAGGGANYFPGNVPGTTSNNGLYL